MLEQEVFEKHFTLNRSNKGTDNAFSLEPQGLAKFVRNIKRIEKMLGSEEKKQLSSETEAINKNEKIYRSKKEIKKNEVLTLENITIKSPGLGIHPYEINNIIGKKANKDLIEDDYIKYEDLV